MAAPMPKSVSFSEEKKKECLRGEYVSYGDVYQNWRTFHQWGGLVFIVDVQSVGR